jgi:uncharacterized protein YjbI with pentapeptide repeats
MVRQRFGFLEVAGWIATVAAVVVGVATWVWEADDRRKQKHYRAWELINSARGSTGDGGRRDALQDLNEDGEDLSAAPLANAYLSNIQLPNADLRGADLSTADLRSANLSGANLSGANLSGAKLRPVSGDTIRRKAGKDEIISFGIKEPVWVLTSDHGRFTNLSGVNLFEANLANADLLLANLSRANLTGADLTGANMAGANLANADLFETNFSNTSLSTANMTGADMTMAELSGVNLEWANLHKANLADVRNLDTAKFCNTTMPDGTLNNRDCLLIPAPPKRP